MIWEGICDTNRTCINAVFIIWQKSVRSSIDPINGNCDIQFANYVLRNYQERLMYECAQERLMYEYAQEEMELHMAFVYHQNETLAVDFTEVDEYIADARGSGSLNTEQNRLFCVDHCREKPEYQQSIVTLWLLAMNLLAAQEDRCKKNNIQTINRIYLITNMGLSGDREKEILLRNAKRWSNLEFDLEIVCGYEGSKGRGVSRKNDLQGILDMKASIDKNDKKIWVEKVCYKDMETMSWRIGS